MTANMAGFWQSGKPLADVDTLGSRNAVRLCRWVTGRLCCIARVSGFSFANQGALSRNPEVSFCEVGVRVV
jgi:hypothetical protein